MKHYTDTNQHTLHTALRRAVMMGVCALATLCTVPTMAQVVIGGNVYGGGNQGELEGNANVELKGGTVKGNVFGGARMADVIGRTYVHINGADAKSALIVKGVYGGNDISGTITGSSDAVPFAVSTTKGVNNTWNAFVRATAGDQPVIIGALYGGGNGDYNYTANGSKYNVTLDDVTYTVDNKPTIVKTYLEVNGGIYGSIYGGGNAATVTEQTVIYANNTTAINGTTNSIPKAGNEFLGLFAGTDYTLKEGNMVFGYHANRIFGGNNLAEMNIRPTWDLQKIDVNNLYSGGNRGNMTHANGIIIALQSDNVRVNNVYGGCRMADVHPANTGALAEETLYGYTFPAGYAARVYITGGKINNVYGGNDISGKVYHGTNVEIHGAISGDIYGGGNGSYAYTDKQDWVNAHPEDADYYYEPGSNSLESLAALYQKRPHVEKTLVHVAGTGESKRVTVVGGLFCGGNSATLAKDGDQSQAQATFKIGKYADIQEVYLGSNGKNMISDEILSKYAYKNTDTDEDFSSLDLTDVGQFATYMEGVTVDIIPTIVWDDDLEYDDTRIGSFFCGGNVGSMTYDGIAGGDGGLNFPEKLVIFDKIVAGCNSANIAAKDGYNAAYEGGLVGNPTNDTKVRMNVHSRLEPGKLDITKDASGKFFESSDYVLNTKPVKVEDANGNVPVYVGANVYGGCYASGYINGGVEINVSKDLISPNVNKEILNRTADYVYASAMAIYGGGYGAGTEIRGNTKLNFKENARVLLAFGGGQMGQVGNNTITGNTVVNFDKDLELPGDDKDKLNVYRAYAGGYAGTITGNTTLNLLGGGVMRAFAGACNADINGYATAIVGCAENYGEGLPYVSNAVLGGNDFGGQIKGSNTWDIEEDVRNKSVTSQTYVQYLSGEIGRAIYGGSYGSYDYGNKNCYPEDVDGEPVTRPVSAPTLSSTFVDIASQSTNANDIIGSDNSESILTLVAGGGRGYKGLPGYVKVDKTYVLLRGAKNRTTPMAHRVYGGGNLSSVGETLVEAYSGNYSQIFGGTHGVLTETATDFKVSYDNTTSTINVYAGINNAEMDIFGAGANSGTTGGTTINLDGGTMRDVHGGAFTEGYTSATTINVLDGSTAQVNALFGGGLGSEEGRPCDVGQSKIIFASADAKVETGIYGGNHTARVTKNSNIVINVPVRNIIGELRNVYGAGLGEHTVSGFTSIDLQPEAKVANVYGGGEEGKVYNHYSYKDNDNVNDNENLFASYPDEKHAHWTNENADNTLIAIREGAIVSNNVYGGGKGTVAYASGKTHVQLLGGSVEGDIYGGGDAGAMPRMTDATNGYISEELVGQTIATYCQIDGGEVRNVFGGGFNGDTEGDTYVAIGSKNPAATFVSGKPTIQRSAYGGGEMAKVTGKATVNMWNGYIGYEYVGGNFRPLLDIEGNDKKLLKENGNLYGAGYGEGAVVMQTFVNLHGGVIRNGLYGGGEIAAVGRGTVKLEENKYVLDTFDEAGKTHVRMYGGLVEGDVFGGGRGFSYDLTGNQVTGKLYYTDGYVFGSTDVEIYRGVIGTDASVAEGHGNVFGGGNIGYVYSAGEKYTGTTEGIMVNGHYYHKGDDPYTTTKVETTANRTEDCRVHITARCMVTADGVVEINKHKYQKGEYVTTEDLNTLAFNAGQWQALDNEGLTIKNAVFAGGNVSAGSDKIYANAVTVYGNATAAVVDVFSKDFIRLGGEHVGGLYGDGNLTFVDGYRELNITNYGTDYYNLSETLSYDDYKNLSERERDYYSLIYLPQEQINFSYAGVRFYYEKHSEDYPVEVRQSAYETLLTAWNAMMEAKWEHNGDGYTAKEAINETNFTYTSGATLTKDEYDTMMAAWTKSMSDKFVIKGECSITAGRMMNTVQRADFCGVFGSRILLHGAQDRVPDVVDYTNYTINRVGEVSLNRVRKGQAGEHGNYFGIYNVVNLLGAFTSDIEFGDPHQYLNDQGESTDTKDDEDKTVSYLSYKQQNFNNRTRNNAVASNMVALASGVFLEIVKSIDENGTKEYGPVTGVIQLDLINVQPGEGGGYVYAKNEHGMPQEVDDETKSHLVLADANTGAITQKAFTYDPEELQVYQTSGNFVHPLKRIVDDCFPRGGYYEPAKDGEKYSPAHYWYIRGDFYVYDQYISAYTGSAQAYPQSVNIPLTITAGSDGKMLLMSVKPNLHAYFVGLPYKSEILKADDKIEINGVTYSMNDPISYWDWSQLPEAEKIYFKEEMNYVAVCDAQVGGIDYKKGHVLTPGEYTTLVEDHPNGYIVEDNNSKEIPTTDVFRITNELSHEAGYLLTFDITNPSIWDDYYTMLDGSDNITKIPENEYNELTAETQMLYTEAPTLLCTKSGIYGQRSYEMDALVGKAVIDSKDNISSEIWETYKGSLGQQAVFEPSYVAIGEVRFNENGQEYHMFKGSYISKTTYKALATSGQTDAQAKFLPAYLCINTIEVADKEYVLNGELISSATYKEYETAITHPGNTFMYNKVLGQYFSPAYVCTTAGKYGGSYFEQTKNYRALEFCDLPRDERNAKNQDGKDVFTYNYDAFDLLATDFDNDMTKYGVPYYGTQPVDFEATYTVGEDKTVKVKVLDSNGNYTGTIAERELKQGDKLSRIEYESLLNEKSHYFPFVVDNSKATTYYIVSREFQRANIYHPVGKTISEEMYNSLTQDQKNGITQITTSETSYPSGTYYYCVEDFVKNGTNMTVKKGSILTFNQYKDLPNYQVGFMVHGHSPIETSTLYVSRESDIQNLSEDRIITVEYKYTYKESEADGSGYETFIEKHVVNIHVQFKSGLPTIGEVTPPAAVLPNSVVGLSVPSVTKGAYEILGGGWEMFETLSDATEHKNGVAYQNNATPMYWYQNGYYVAYFAKTYLGKAYSNPVPFTIANYHRLGEVMNHEQRMYIDHKDVDRASKIYLDAAPYPSTSIAADYDENDPLVSPNGKTDGKNDLDYLYDLYQETKNGQTLVVEPTIPYVFNTRIKSASNLEFILRSDIAPKKYAGAWKQIGDSENCFAGTLHGNGYTISGLDKSLFNYLCGNVYNLGVTGSFTGGGVADHGGTKGHAENCWVYTTAKLEENTTTKAIFSDDGGKIVNSYYLADNNFAEGQAIEETKTDFEQGEVAYQLNHFYLNKRYSDNTPSITDNPYKYMHLNVADNTLSKQVGHYTDEHAIYEFAGTSRGYVEDYYADGDFIYANGEIPLTVNERLDQEDKMYYPIYPDDYIFFGQRLSYQGSTHNDLPVRIKKQTVENKERIVRVREANRVYRAPAYYKSKKKKEAYFNINAAFVDAYNDTPVDRDMTAIDFTGYDDNTYSAGHEAGVFHMPILDYEGLSGISIDGLTPNLLVYANTADKKTYTVLSNYLKEPELSIGTSYEEIAPVLQTQMPHGHLVDFTGGDYKATRDHFLVDKENFNAPIAYTFDKDKENNGVYMWYQRTPDRFADGTGKGWDVVCLPFTAGLVTTHQKGEITHFYGNSTKMHEYWLRELNGVAETKATFARPAAVDANGVYPATNDFLYKYYYSKCDDQNTDDYQLYYKNPRNYAGYAYLTTATPYIVAFPGSHYREFDMSGTFVPENTANRIDPLQKQVVTMVSAPGTTIAVTDTDDEAQDRKVTKNGYTFVGTYQDNTLPAGAYLIDSDGDSFDSATGEAVAVPFRGYLVKTSGTQAPPKRIFISGAAEEDEPMEEVTNRGLTIYGKKDAIYIESTLEHETTVIIYGLSGQVIARVKVQPMSKEVVTVPSRGVYIVNKRKVAVL